MNIAFIMLVLLGAVLAYYVLSFAFGLIGSMAEKIYKSFNKNIGKEEGGNNNE